VYQESNDALSVDSAPIENQPLAGEGASGDVMFEEAGKQQKRRRRKSIVSDVVFYCVLIVVVAVLLLSASGGNGAPRNFAGFSAMTVLTGSMQSEIPKGSFIITQKVDPASLQTGDVITYMKDENTTITHKIVGIYDDYESTGQIGFVTRGIENPENDKPVVLQDNVVGKVVFANLMIGEVLTFIKANLLFVSIFAGLFIVMFAALGTFMKRSHKNQAANQTQ